MKNLIIALSLILAFNIGCSSLVKHTAMDHADWLVMYQIDKYYDLNDNQEEQIAPLVLKEIKSVQIIWVPVIIKDLEYIATLDRKLTKSEIEKFFVDNPRQYWSDYINPKIPLISQFFATLTSDQYKYFLEAFKEQFEERWERAHLTEDKFKDSFAELQEERLEKLEKWFGPFSVDQKKRIIQKTHQSLPEYKIDAMEYKERREIFVKTIEVIKDDDSRKKFLKDWYQFRFKRKLDKQDSTEKFRTESSDFWVFIEGILTKNQIKARQAKIKETIKDLQYFQKVKY